MFAIVKLALLLATATARRGEVELTAEGAWPAGRAPPTTEAYAVVSGGASDERYGNFGVRLRNLVAVRVTGRCEHLDLDGAALTGKTLVVSEASRCAGRTHGLLVLLANSVTGAINAIIGSPEAGVEGDDVEPNFRLLPASRAPAFVAARPSSTIISVPSEWLGNLTEALRVPELVPPAASIFVTMALERIELGAASTVRASVAASHILYYTYVHEGTEPVDIVVTPRYGNPDLYVNVGESLDAVPLPNPQRSVTAAQTSPGDDSLAVPMADPRARALVIGVYGASASDFELILSIRNSIIPLASGVPQRCERGPHAAPRPPPPSLRPGPTLHARPRPLPRPRPRPLPRPRPTPSPRPRPTPSRSRTPAPSPHRRLPPAPRPGTRWVGRRTFATSPWPCRACRRGEGAGRTGRRRPRSRSRSRPSARRRPTCTSRSARRGPTPPARSAWSSAAARARRARTSTSRSPRWSARRARSRSARTT